MAHLEEGGLMGLSINVEKTPAGLLISVEGEVDVSNAPELRAVLDEALEQGSPDETDLIEVDLEQVPYIDSTGIGVLVGATHRASERGMRLVVARPQRNVARVLALLGLDGQLGVTGA